MPAIATKTAVYDVHDCAVYAMLTDVAGASPTYGAKVDVPGIATVSTENNLVTSELKGDARVIAKKGRVDRINFSATYGKLDLAAQLVLSGGSVTASGTTPNQKQVYRIASPAPLPYFKVEFLILDVDTGLGDLHVLIYKCQITSNTPLDSSSDSFSQPKFDAEGIALEGTLGSDTGVMMDMEIRETASVVSA